MTEIRAEWWREVTDPAEIIPRGCPVRFEDENTRQGLYYASERIVLNDFPRRNGGEIVRVFIDSRWAPPKPTYKVGDTIESYAPEAMPADGVGVVDVAGEVGQIINGRIHWSSSESCGWDYAPTFVPLTVIYVPETEEKE